MTSNQNFGKERGRSPEDRRLKGLRPRLGRCLSALGAGLLLASLCLGVGGGPKPACAQAQAGTHAAR